MLENRILKNIRSLKSYLSNNNIEAYRLYDHDIPELPFFIERYGDKAVVWDRSDQDKDNPKDILRQKEIIEGLMRKLSINQTIFKTRFRQDFDQRYSKQRESLVTHITENDLVFEVELLRYVDTGLFLDHRPLRSWLRKSHPQELLNLFCYTGSLSTAAAKNGSKTTNVDLSKTYLSWAKRNFKRNNLSTTDHSFINSSTEDFLDSCRTKFDIIVLDPPTFSVSKKTDSNFDIQRDHSELIEKCVGLLRSGGSLYFSTNKKKFKLQVDQQLNTQDLTAKSIPPDFHRKNVHRLWRIRN